MLINKNAGAFRPIGGVEKALTMNVHSTGELSVTSDIADATVDVVEDEETGTFAINEVIADGSIGESFSLTINPEAAETEPEEAPEVEVDLEVARLRRSPLGVR